MKDDADVLYVRQGDMKQKLLKDALTLKAEVILSASALLVVHIQ